MQHALSGPIVFEKLAGEFKLLAHFKATYSAVLDFSYIENTELKLLTHNMDSANLPSPDLWKSIQFYGSSKLKSQP